jgi:hypothetical protein
MDLLVMLLSEQVISRNNVGGVVQRNALTLEGAATRMDQAMRLAIAEEVPFEAEKRGK